MNKLTKRSGGMESIKIVTILSKGPLLLHPIGSNNLTIASKLLFQRTSLNIIIYVKHYSTAHMHPKSVKYQKYN